MGTKMKAGSESESHVAAWEKCPCCDNFICVIHGGHAHDCACPPLEVWDTELGLVPYDQGGDLTPEALAQKLAAIGYVPE